MRNSNCVVKRYCKIFSLCFISCLSFSINKSRIVHGKQIHSAGERKKALMEFFIFFSPVIIMFLFVTFKRPGK